MVGGVWGVAVALVGVLCGGREEGEVIRVWGGGEGLEVEDRGEDGADEERGEGEGDEETVADEDGELVGEEAQVVLHCAG